MIYYRKVQCVKRLPTEEKMYITDVGETLFVTTDKFGKPLTKKSDYYWKKYNKGTPITYWLEPIKVEIVALS